MRKQGNALRVDKERKNQKGEARYLASLLIAHGLCTPAGRVTSPKRPAIWPTTRPASAGPHHHVFIRSGPGRGRLRRPRASFAARRPLPGCRASDTSSASSIVASASPGTSGSQQTTLPSKEVVTSSGRVGCHERSLTTSRWYLSLSTGLAVMMSEGEREGEGGGGWRGGGP